MNYGLVAMVYAFGYLNNKDLTDITKHVNNNVTLKDAGVANADVNDDGIVNGSDISVLEKYLSGEYNALPYRTSEIDLAEKNLPGIKMAYPKNWNIKEINKNMWNYQPGEPTCAFDGDFNSVEIKITCYEPLEIEYGYENLFKQECLKYGLQYFSGIEEIGHNYEAINNNSVDWRYLEISNGLRCYYYIQNEKAYKIKVELDNGLQNNNIVPAERVIDDVIYSLAVN